ncbi:putative cell division cycle protein 27 [Cocos nucifera]|uniref:Putative cell division cycle protein 27 n=1 Tax=Cocos nucifera TaxID=13894 RepID=A0A8K0MUP5_COCNU|nr:putative cell division cycle protein 27 [Cocos nucifera]
METLMVDRVQGSLRLFMYGNAIFICERLCAEFPSEEILKFWVCKRRKGRILISKPKSFWCFIAQFATAGDLLFEKQPGLLRIPYFERFQMEQQATIFLVSFIGAAEEASECFNDAAAFRVQQQQLSESSSQNLTIGTEYQSLPSSMALGSGDSSPRHSKQLHANNTRETLSHPHGTVMVAGHPPISGPSNISQYYTPPAVTQLSGVAPPPLCRNAQLYLNAIGGDGYAKSNVNAAIQAPRRKFVDEGKLRKDGFVLNKGVFSGADFFTANKESILHDARMFIMVDFEFLTYRFMLMSFPTPEDSPFCSLYVIGIFFLQRALLHHVIFPPLPDNYSFTCETVSGRLFSDSGPRRSTRLSGEAAANTNSNASQLGGNGTNHFSSKSLGGLSSSSSKTNSAVLRSVTLRRGQSWANENFDEDNTVTTSSSMSALADGKCLEQDKMGCGILAHDSRLASGIREFLGLLRTLGDGYRLSCLYRSQEALEVYLRLSQHQFNTGWVLSQVGKAHFELVDYFEADRFFNLACRVSPYTLEGMDIYSTVLYHLEEEMKLSYLAQELISVDRLSPQAWCAMGNCYSLQKDHETALKIFQRAVYVALEDFENGIKCYQSALQVDERHYNAWYGLGVVYLRQEKFEFAEHHFRKAFHINPRSSVLMCYLGMALHSLKRDEEALEIMEKAISADKKNPLPMYQKANILSSLERFDEALKELEQLKEYAPCESSVYALMGKIYKRLNMHEKAMFYFGIALDLKPPAADVAAIKSAMEKLYLPDELEDTL